MVDSATVFREFAMRALSFPVLASGIVGLAMCASLNARAAVTVLGPGPAQECFRIAEYGGDVHEGIARCSFALNTALSTVDRAATFVNRGVLKLSLHQSEQALADINTGISIAPDLGDAYVDRGAVGIALGRYDDALADLNKGIALGPHRPQVAYYDRAIIYEQQGDIRSAYYDYKKALEIAPDFAPAAEELKRFRVVQKNGGA
jgi:tetratricopeptide (TPR) repeat protein